MTLPTLNTGIESTVNKVHRSVFLFAHLLTLCFVMGDYLFWSDSAPSGSFLCRSSRLTTIVFYKPFFASTCYCLNFLYDTSGSGTLWHNPFTDSIVAVLMILLLTWTVCSVVVSLPVLACFFFFTILFFIPPIAYSISMAGNMTDFAEKKKVAERTKKKEDKDKVEALKPEYDATVYLLKRLCFYSIFACLVFGVYLFPFYEGEGYVHVLERTAAALVPSLRFWAPNFSLSFSWPHVSFPSQFGLALSLAVISMEYALMGGQVLLAYAYPKGYAFVDMYTEEFGETGKVDKAHEELTTTSSGQVELVVSVEKKDQLNGGNDGIRI